MPGLKVDSTLFCFDMLDGFYLLASVLLLPLWIWQILRGTKRLDVLWRRAIGIAPLVDDGRVVVWFHAASVGEALSLGPLLEHLGKQPSQYRLVISTETLEGLRAARTAFAGDVTILHVPLDLSWCVRRAYNAIRPRLLVLSELELWPNLLLEAQRRGLPVAVVNSRMNDADYRFFQRINRWHRPALAAIHWWGAQTQRDAERIRQLAGLSQTRVEVTGSVKFDVTPDQRASSSAHDLYRRLGFSAHERIFLAGSTHASEELLLLEAFRTLSGAHPELRLILVPRHSRRFRRVAAMLRRSAIPFVQRSLLTSPLDRSAPVTLLDSIGELTALWRHADFGFVGGSLAPDCGGQNMIEPAALGKPVCFGPNVWNFSEAAEGLLRARGARQVGSASDVVRAVEDWLSDPELARQMGENALAFVRSRQGAAARTVRALDELLSAGRTLQREPVTK